MHGNVSLRGDSNVTILIDGKPSSQFEGDNKAQALQTMPADSIERVEVVTNPSTEFRADGSAGIINLITKRGKGAGVTGSLRLILADGDRFAASANTGYNSKRLTLAVDLSARQDTQKQQSVDDRLTSDPAGGFDTLDTGGVGGGHRQLVQWPREHRLRPHAPDPRRGRDSRQLHLLPSGQFGVDYRRRCEWSARRQLC